jgi:hypothetical protein
MIKKLVLKHPILIVAIIAIVIISQLFHYHIFIQDAISLRVADDFGIKISIWRVAFEPVLGLLLFFNRSLYSIDEILLTVYWVIFAFGIYTIIKTFFISKKKHFIINQLTNFPLIIGLWFTFFVIIIFVSLPNNTIINNSEKSVLVTTHSHSHFSHDGLIEPINLWKWHKYNGYDAFFITDHNTHSQTFDFVKDQRNNKFAIEPLVMVGEEFSGTNHLSLLGLKRNFDTDGYTDQRAIDSTRASNGAVIVNHWFDGQHKSLEYYANLQVDGFEIENSALNKLYDRDLYKKIRQFNFDNNLIMNAGLDYHGYGNSCSLWNAFEIPNWTDLNPNQKEEAILNIIKSKDQSKLRVLKYRDREYYKEDNLIIRPLFTLFNYFRTLNISQAFSWIFWLVFFTFINAKTSINPKIETYTSSKILIPTAGIFSSIFMLVLGVKFYLGIAKVIGSQNDVYAEYSTILFYVGTIFLAYSVIIAFARMQKLLNR